MAIEIEKIEEKVERKYRHTCKCGTTFTFLASDGKLSSCRNELLIDLNCPTCKAQFYKDHDDYIAVEDAKHSETYSKVTN